MGIVKYKGNTYSNIMGVVVKGGQLHLHSEFGGIEIIDLKFDYNRSRVQIKHEGVKGWKGACRIEMLHSNNCVQIEGDVGQVIAKNMLEVTGKVNTVKHSSFDILSKRELINKYNTLAGHMERRFEDEEPRKIIHLYGQFNLVGIEQVGSVEVWINKCDVVNCVTDNSVVIKGNVNTAKAGNRVKCSKIKGGI